MTTHVVCDASALVALLLDSDTEGRWATRQLTGAELAAPSLAAYEPANVIRRHELAGLVTTGQTRQAHTDLRDLAVELWPYDVVASRAWQLRRALSLYDASYVALAELIDAPLITLDRRTSRTPELRCVVVTP